VAEPGRGQRCGAGAESSPTMATSARITSIASLLTREILTVPNESVAQDRGGSSGADQLRSVRGQHDYLGPGDHGLLDSALDEHLRSWPAQCGFRVRAEHGRSGGASAPTIGWRARCWIRLFAISGQPIAV